MSGKKQFSVDLLSGFGDLSLLDTEQGKSIEPLVSQMGASEWLGSLGVDTVDLSGVIRVTGAFSLSNGVHVYSDLTVKRLDEIGEDGTMSLSQSMCSHNQLTGSCNHCLQSHKKDTLKDLIKVGESFFLVLEQIPAPESDTGLKDGFDALKISATDNLDGLSLTELDEAIDALKNVIGVAQTIARNATKVSAISVNESEVTRLSVTYEALIE
ncbi:hypothetical protein [Vibrio crassostreae]|uniref:hypothetical protein n=1 Tax=Vibrio crassostreae TaxID=246167 RepID=UPI001B303EA9|nr:hypothetical protein [Vibrio crassostreae]